MAIEGGARKSIVQTRASIEHVQLDGSVDVACGDGDRARAVAERIVEQVSQRLLDSQRVGRQCCSGWHLRQDRSALLLSACSSAPLKDPAVDKARIALTELRSDPQLGARAPA